MRLSLLAFHRRRCDWRRLRAHSWTLRFARSIHTFFVPLFQLFQVLAQSYVNPFSFWASTPECVKPFLRVSLLNTTPRVANSDTSTVASRNDLYSRALLGRLRIQDSS